MEVEDLILVQSFCVNHDIEFSFINSLHEAGLIEVIFVEENQYIHKDQLKDLEKMIRLYYELDINVEGLDAIFNVLYRVVALQEEVRYLKNRLGLYENDKNPPDIIEV